MLIEMFNGNIAMTSSRMQCRNEIGSKVMALPESYIRKYECIMAKAMDLVKTDSESM